MTSLMCVCAAGLIHLMHKWVLLPDRSNVPVPQYSSVVVAFALLDLIYHNRLIPDSLEVMPVVLQRICEMIGTIFLLELGIFFWNPVERNIHLLAKIILLGTGLLSEGVFLKHEIFWLSFVTMPLSLMILVIVGQATDHFPFLRSRTNCVRTTVRLNVEPTLRFVRRLQRANGEPLPQYAETLQQYKDAATRRRRGMDFLRHFPCGDADSL